MPFPRQSIGWLAPAAALIVAHVCFAQAQQEPPAVEEAFQQVDKLLSDGDFEEAVKLLDVTADKIGRSTQADRARYCFWTSGPHHVPPALQSFQT